MEDINFVYPSEECDPLVPRVLEKENTMVSITREENMLIVYEEKLPISGSHRARIKHKESFQKCIARPFESVNEAARIYNLLMRCKHPNLLSPLGLWACEDGVILDNPKLEKDVNGEEAKKEKMKIKAFIAYPNFDGALVEISKEEMFLVDKGGSQTTAYGFTCQGSKLFCHILDVVDHINGLYGASIPLVALRVNSGRIIYKKVAEGEYQVMLWGDFFTDLPTEKGKKTKKDKPTDPTVDDIQSANLSSIGTYLKSWLNVCKVRPNKELNQLSTMLIKGKTLNYNDIKWEPGLWSVNIKILFIREVFWCADNDQAKKTALKHLPSLGLKNCISELGFDHEDGNLFDSVMFLRKKIVAHQDSLYKYGGKEDDVGFHNQTIEIKIQTERPDYMIKLVKQMRQLNWIKDSPLLRSSRAYIQPFKHPTC